MELHRSPFSGRYWPWIVLFLTTLPAIWYVIDHEEDIDPEFPRVARPTFNVYPPAAYRFAEPGDTIDHIAVYISSAALVLCGWGWLRDWRRRPAWAAAFALSAVGFWHAATPGPLMDGWVGLGWRNMMDSRAPAGLRVGLGLGAFLVALSVLRVARKRRLASWFTDARRNGVLGLITFAAFLMLLRQVNWVDREPFGFWPRWIYVWGLLAWALAILRVSPSVPAGWSRGKVVATLVVFSIALDITGRGIFWYQRPLRRLREVVPGRLYLSAMPSAWGLELAQRRHHFRTIVNLFPEHTLERSPHLADELRIARQHGINYLGSPPDDPTGEAFVSHTLELSREPSAWPILIHCHASMDRSPAWVGLYRFVIQGWPLADALREIEQHRGLRPKASVTLLYNRMLPKLDPVRTAADPTAALLIRCARGTVDPVARLAASSQVGDEKPVVFEPGSSPHRH